MKKVLFVLITLLTGVLSSFSQTCTPDANCANPSCPDTSQVMNATQNQAFTQTITLNIPSTVVHPVYGTLTLDSVVINNFANLPAGLTWATECGTTTQCTYLPGIHCLLLTGTPTAVGSYTINLNTTPYSMGQGAAQTSHYLIDVAPPPCAADPNCSAPSCPDTATVMTAQINQSFTQTITLNIPNTIVHPVYGTLTLDSVVINNFANLPAGLTWSTECGTTTSCTYLPGQHCLMLSGIPTTAGSYTIDLVTSPYSAGQTQQQTTHYLIDVVVPPCTADPNCTAASCPDTATVMTAQLNQSFTQTITLNIPNTIVHPVYGTLALDSVVINNFSNLPAGLSWSTECGATTSCTYLPGMHCLLLTGTPTAAGSYTISLNTNPYSAGQTQAQTAHYLIDVVPPACTADPNCTASSCPDTATVMTAQINQSFTQTITLNIPNTIVHPVYGTLTLDSVVINNFSNLPAGLSWSTECGATTSCTYLPGMHCLLLTGTPTAAGSYTINLNTNPYTMGQTQAQTAHYLINVVSPVSTPTITTTTVSLITPSSASSGGTIVGDGGATITASGVVWGTSNPPSVPSANSTAENATSGTFTSSMSGLTPSTVYYVRAYATNSAGTAYGSVMTFTTSAAGSSPCNADANCTAASCPDTATVMTGVVNQAFSQTITLNIPSTIVHPVYGTLTLDSVVINNFSNLPAGFNWSTECGAATACTYLPGLHCLLLSGIPTATGSYTISLNTNPYTAGQTQAQVAHYLITISGLPIVTTTAASSVTSSSASTGGDVTSDGYSTVTTRGVVYSTSQNPAIGGGGVTNLADANGGTGTFTSSISGLTPSTTYYVRAYATNANGTSYGAQQSFTTSAVLTAPVISTTAASSVTTNSASSGGNVTSDGGTVVTARGIVYSTSQNPTLATGTNVADVNGGTGTFSSSLSGLTSGTVYYVVAYATNSVGTTYGNQVSFTTLTLSVPSLVTTAASAITTSSASSGGNITSDGNSTVTTRGIVYSTSPNPAVGGGGVTNVADANGGTGSFTSALSGLAQSTTYYVRAYATNAQGTGYGNQITFSTQGLVTFTNTPATSVTTINTANAQVTGGGVANNGGSAVTATGIVWSTSPNPTLSNGTSASNTSGNTSTITAQMTGLSAGTTYYVTTYATNASGTSYGTVVAYTAPPVISGCSPNLSTTILGISPDSTVYKANGDLNYSQTFTYNLPFSYTNSNGELMTVDRSYLVDILNLPMGLSLQCGRPNCLFYPGESGCFVVSGVLPSIDDIVYPLIFVVKDSGVINTSQYGPQALETYYQNGFNADTVLIVVGNGVSPLGINSIDSDEFGIISCSPNPFVNSVAIKYNSPNMGNVTLNVSDVYGRDLYSTSVQAVAGTNTIEYDSSNLSSGIYCFTISNGVHKVTIKLIAIK